MPETQTTQPSLLLRIRSPQDAESWSSFEATYRPLVFGFLRRRGLQDADAADLTQDVLSRVASAIKTFEYSPEKGSFRAWLFTIVQNCLRRFIAGQSTAARGSGDTRLLRLLESQPAADEDQWNQEYQRQLLKRAADEICHEFQDSTWRAFWATAVDGRQPQAVAQELGLSVAAVYMARHRITARLRERIQYLDGGQP